MLGTTLLFTSLAVAILWFRLTKPETRRNALVWFILAAAMFGLIGIVIEFLTTGRIAAPPSY